ncbi:MAG: SAM-dependent chlorinase/fluorinase [Acidobacteriia bacterium]|nr:SAM-dependent chlorinase/fluorinase [Terriglobia bacterium]
MPRQPIVTLITDFDTADHFVGTMKGVILNINPDVEIVDICHEVASYDIFDAAFTLAQSYRFFPPDTIHLVVVDPGVGTARRPLLARTGAYRFVAPDNGVLSLIYEREQNVEVRHITADHYFLNPVSNTFQGRDIFAPVVGWLSKWVEVDKFGDLVTDYAKFTSPKPKRVSDNLIKGVVLKVDKFGNIITNLTPEDVSQLFSENPPPFKIIINQQEITRLNLAYSMGKPSEIFAIVGSSGYIEICTNRGSAAKTLDVNRGVEVGVMLGSPSPVVPESA